MRFKSEITLVIILLVILATVSFTGIITYQKLTSIVTNVREEIKPDTRLLTARSLVNNLNDAEINVKSYRITGDTLYLDGFYEAIAQVDSSLENLHSFDVTRTNLDMNQLDSLIDLKLDVLNDLMFLQGGERTQKALDRVVDEIEFVEKRSDNPEDNEEGSDETEEKNKFFKRLFNWKSKKDAETQETNSIELERRETLTLETVNQEVDEIKKDERRFDQEYRTFELALIQRDKVISDQIITFFDKLERFELDEIAAESEATEEAITRANDQLVIFSTFIGALLLFMAFMIFNYFRNNNRYKKALKKSEKEARELAAIKERFLSKMSHEIRTPMNAIIGFSEQVSKGPLNMEQKEHLGRVMNASDHLVYLLNEILDLSKLRANKIHLESIPFSPKEVFENVLAYLKNETATSDIKANLVLPPDLPEVLIGDPYRLRQVLYNLTNNALKFTAKGHITMEVKISMEQNQCILEAAVKDTGKGIAKDRVDKIFNEFEQEDNSVERKFGGTGLGLAIVKQIVSLSEGDISISSELGKGTSVRIQIPYAIGHQKLDKEVNTSHESTKSGTIDLSGYGFLVVDDEPMNRMIIREILKPKGVQLTEVDNGIAAIEECKNNQYDIVLMDIRMPELNGVDATKKIRELKLENAEVPIVALTAAVSDVDKKAFIEAGMNGLIVKPFKEEQLIQALNQIIQQLNIKPQSFSSKLQLNLALLEEMGEGDSAFVKDMLETFRNGLLEADKLMEKAVQEKNQLGIADQAHKMGPSCYHMGALDLYQMMKEIELNIRQEKMQDFSEVLAKLSEIKPEIKRVLDTIESELKELK